MAPVVSAPAVVAVALLAACAASPGLAQDAPPAQDDDRLRALVWAAADADAAAYPGALRAVEAAPGASWRLVHDLLALGRTYPAKIEEPLPPADEAFQAYFGAFPFEPGKVRTYDLGDGWRNWYSFRLPAGWDGRSPLAAFVNLGGVAPTASADLAIVTLDARITSRATLGRAPISMTGGVAFQSVVLSVVADLERRFPVDRDRVLVGGYSRAGNATWYLAAHWPGLWAGAVPASGYYPCDDAVVPNLFAVPLFAARGTDAGHKGANEFTATFADRLVKAGHTSVTSWCAQEGAAGPELEAALVPWIAARRRDPLPGTVGYALLDPNHTGTSWVEIDEAKDPGGTQTVIIRDASGEEHERLSLHRKASSVRARLSGKNEIDLRATNVATLRLLLSPAQFDLDRPVKVRVGARTLSFDPLPRISLLLDRFRRDRDRRRLFAAEIVVKP